MMKKIGVFLLSGICAFISQNGLSQGIVETALLFSRTTPGGSARMQGMGGVQVSLGGDFSSASSNPAGLGMFNRSEFTITPSYSFANAKSTYLENTINESKSNLSIPSLSFAFHSEKNKGSWISGTFAITLTRLNDFNSSFKYEGINRDNSIVDFFAIDSDTINPMSFSGDKYNTLNGLAFNTYLIEPYQNMGDPRYHYYSKVNYNPDAPNDIPAVKQGETIQISGGQNQWSASYGINIDDRFFLGVGLHLRTIRYESKKTYTESDYTFFIDPTYSPLINLSLEESLKISGSGYSATIGGIFRPIEGLQLGLAYNTPTIYTLSDVYSAHMTANWNGFDYYGDGDTILDTEEEMTDEILSDYKLKTPGRISGGATYFFDKSGFISGEVDFVNFDGARYTSKTAGYEVEEDNAIIKSLYQPVLNVRIGGEYRLNQYRFRGGVGYQGEPYTEKQYGVSRTKMNYSIGFGYKTSKFYLDGAITLKTGKSAYSPYDKVPYGNIPLVAINNLATGFLFTLGFPF